MLKNKKQQKEQLTSDQQPESKLKCQLIPVLQL